MLRRTCSLCGKPSVAAIYLALPLRMCEDDDCGCVWGPGSYAMCLWYNGVLMIYGGSYLRALVYWLFRI